MRKWAKTVVLTFSLLALVSVRAEVAYVSNGLNLGVHEADSLTSTIRTLVPPGTRLEVLEEKGSLVRVRLGDGMEGWVNGRYLTQNTPPSQPAGQNAPPSRPSGGLEAELVQTATELAKARELASELEYQLNREKERSKIMEADLLAARKALEQEPANSTGNPSASADALNKLRKANEATRRLNKRVTELEADLKAAASENGEAPAVVYVRDPSSNDDASLFYRYTAITHWAIWQVMLLFFGLLLAFAVGAYLVDWEVRRRHGGFRV